MSSFSAETQAVLDHIRADSLRGHLSFLASDLLEGRDTPSRGLEVAAEYIAAQFRRSGLEPAGDTGYFQTAKFLQVEAAKARLQLTLQLGERALIVGKSDTTVSLRAALTLDRAAVLWLRPGDPTPPREQVTGKVVALERQSFRGRLEAVKRTLAPLQPALVLVLEPGRAGGESNRPALVEAGTGPGDAPTISIRGKVATEWFTAVKASAPGASVSLRIPAPAVNPIQLRNVIGILRGSDPALNNTYVLVTAHYDHLGVKPDVAGDRIFNGANDDASGTASVIELASALATLRMHPRRSIIFMTFFGEERGELGSQYYARHPVFPLAQTIADLNLEQLGRTDSSEGPRAVTGNFTGFDYSDLPEIFVAAGQKTGIRVFQDDSGSDRYFAASDNFGLANKGVPAHTFSVTYEFPDYHRVGDEWDKIDYDNMAKVDRMLAVGLLDLANRTEPPQWNEANPKAARYVKAWKDLHAQ